MLEGTLAICQAVGCSLSDLVEIVHGTTLVTNALIERCADRTGMLVTQGFRDLFDIGREQRYDLFDLRLRYAEPIVERGLRADIPERLKHDGSVLVPLYEEAVAAQTRRLVEEERIEALAIRFRHAHVDDRHELRAREIAQALYPTTETMRQPPRLDARDRVLYTPRGMERRRCLDLSKDIPQKSLNDKSTRL